jgi:hypothetical protein
MYRLRTMNPITSMRQQVSAGCWPEMHCKPATEAQLRQKRPIFFLLLYELVIFVPKGFERHGALQDV